MQTQELLGVSAKSTRVSDPGGKLAEPYVGLRCPHTCHRPVLDALVQGSTGHAVRSYTRRGAVQIREGCVPDGAEGCRTQRAALYGNS